MSLPPAPLPSLAATSIAINPLEHAFMAINTNPYFIGLMMLALNLGGRFLGMEISKDQEKIFQNPWVRRALFFSVLFVATRNVFVAGIMTIFVLLLLSFLFNENSELCLWKDGCESKDKEQPQSGLTPEETEIWRRLNEKQMRMAAAQKSKQDDLEQDVLSIDAIYSANLAKLSS